MFPLMQLQQVIYREKHKLDLFADIYCLDSYGFCLYIIFDHQALPVLQFTHHLLKTSKHDTLLTSDSFGGVLQTGSRHGLFNVKWQGPPPTPYHDISVIVDDFKH